MQNCEERYKNKIKMINKWPIKIPIKELWECLTMFLANPKTLWDSGDEISLEGGA